MNNIKAGFSHKQSGSKQLTKQKLQQMSYGNLILKLPVHSPPKTKKSNFSLRNSRNVDLNQDGVLSRSHSPKNRNQLDQIRD
jgi:hypothetical protein